MLSKKVKEIYKFFQTLNRRRAAIKEAKNAERISYFSEKVLKPEAKQKKENIEWAKKYGEYNRFYTLYGLDVEGSEADKYIDYYSFMVTRNQVNKVASVDCQIALLRDKFLFYKYMKSNNLPVSDVFAIMYSGKLYDIDFNELKYEDIFDKKDYFIKDIGGECASFVKHIRNKEDLEHEWRNIRSGGGYIFQCKVIQSDKMNIINPNAINTYRVVTINRNGKIYVLSVILRIGTSKTGNVDNWAAGGIAIGISSDGFLKEYGFYKPNHGLKIDIHPDTKIKFSTYKAPELEKVLEIACKAHKVFYGIRAIGWDIAISENGPVFIEGNDNWEISLMQACDRPLKAAWLQAIE